MKIWKRILALTAAVALIVCNAAVFAVPAHAAAEDYGEDYVDYEQYILGTYQSEEGLGTSEVTHNGDHYYIDDNCYIRGFEVYEDNGIYYFDASRSNGIGLFDVIVPPYERRVLFCVDTSKTADESGAVRMIIYVSCLEYIDEEFLQLVNPKYDVDNHGPNVFNYPETIETQWVKTDGGAPVGGTEADGPINQEVEKDAADTPGEDEGVDINPDIILGPQPSTPTSSGDASGGGDSGGNSGGDSDGGAGGGAGTAVATAVGGAVAAAGAAGAAAATAGASGGGGKKKKEEKEEEQEKRPSFRMYINKNFGDTLIKGGESEAVYARIAEIKDGYSNPRDDLSAQIQIMSGSPCISVETPPGDPSPGWKAAFVSVPNKDCLDTEGVVSFRWAGQYGSFTENVRFNVAGEPYIGFVDPDAPESPRYRHSSLADALIGDMDGIDVYFRVFEVVGDVAAVEVASKNSKLSVSCEKVVFQPPRTPVPNLYKLTVRNSVEKVDPPVKKFSRKGETVNIRARDSKGKEIAGELEVYLYPEGISIDISDYAPGDVRDGYFEIQTNELDYMLNPPAMEPAVMRAVFAAKKDRTVHTVWEGIVCDCVLKPEDDKSKCVIESVKCKFSNKSAKSTDGQPLKSLNGYFTLSLDRSLLMMEADEMFVYTLRFSYRGEAGNGEFALPVRLLGEVLDKVKYNREREIKAICRLISLLELDENEQYRKFRRCLPEIPVKDLSKYRWAIYADGLAYQYAKQQGYMKWSTYMDRTLTLCGAARWFGDIAASYCIGTWCGKFVYAEAIIVPIKDAVLNYAAEWKAADTWGYEPPDFWTIERLRDIAFDIADNVVFTYITKPENLMATDKKALFQMFGLAASVNFCKHAWKAADEAKNIDEIVSKAFRETVKDLSVKTLKFIILRTVLKHVDIVTRGNNLPAVAKKYQKLSGEAKSLEQAAAPITKEAITVSRMAKDSSVTAQSMSRVSKELAGDKKIWEGLAARDDAVGKLAEKELESVSKLAATAETNAINAAQYAAFNQSAAAASRAKSEAAIASADAAIAKANKAWNEALEEYNDFMAEFSVYMGAEALDKLTKHAAGAAIETARAGDGRQGFNKRFGVLSLDCGDGTVEVPVAFVAFEFMMDKLRAWGLANTDFQTLCDFRIDPPPENLPFLDRDKIAEMMKKVGDDATAEMYARTCEFQILDL